MAVRWIALWRAISDRSSSGGLGVGCPAPDGADLPGFGGRTGPDPVARGTGGARGAAPGIWPWEAVLAPGGASG